MESKNMIASVIALVITVLLVSTLLIPTISYSATEYAIYKNTGTYFSAVSDDDVVHTIVISTGQGSFVITTDDRVDITPSMGTYNPGGQYVADAIGIGMYEGYYNSTDGIMQSVSGVTPSGNAIGDSRTYTLANNKDNTFSTYQLINWYGYTLYKMMSLTVMGNTDSQYIMGSGISTGTNPGTTGTTTASYVVSADNSSVSMFVENAWGSLEEWIGDMKTTNNTILAGNTLGGQTYNNIVNTLETPPALLTIEGTTYWINGIDITHADSFGVPTSLADNANTAGQGINDRYRLYDNNRVVSAYGGAYDGLQNGLFYLRTLSTSTASNSRISMIIPDLDSTATTYGYVISFGTNGNTITDVQSLVNGVLTSYMPDLTGESPVLNDYWDFDTTTGLGPFGSYYGLINLSSGANTDDETEPRLSTVKGEIAYILNPNDWTETLAGNSYTASEYNAMLIVPTMYWGVSDEKLYMSNDPSTFSDVEGLEMHAYAHTYTVDPTVDTGNPNTTSSASIVFGEDAIVRLYETGDVMIIGTNGATRIGQVVGDTTVTLTVTGNTLSYTGGTMSKVLAYISSDGEYVYAKNPMVTDNSTIIIGGYAHDLETTEDDVVDIGYCASSKVSEFATTTVTELNPVSTSSYTVDETTTTVNTSSVTTNLKRIDSILFETSWEDSGTDKGSSTATYTYFLAPASVTYNNPDYVGDQYSTILTVIPVLVILGILITVAGLVAYSRR